MQLSTYLEQNSTNHYKMLVIVDNNHQQDKIINALQDKGWTSYDVEENIIKITGLSLNTATMINLVTKKSIRKNLN